ncbi:alpha/beta hydrolase [Thioalkalivibrio sp. XN8]|uniref:alpha/beta fold hydrolase n=1 Tax=Thioalkalivibrio sp. XN8 TaxID=2712863 RepID=UPI0013EA8465|nr:alpha/beta hydrolase [Thioalkalivibrio sp. XN8]NGP54098.1 alpha/beta hydrolase [Thioalkalivibrio sp. XN8]
MSLRRVLLALLLGGLAILLVALGAAWAPDRPVEQLVERWAPPPSEFIPLQGMQVHLRDEGLADDRVPVLLLHGTSSSLHTWDGWVPALGRAERVIRVDLPGFGLTGPFPHDDYGIERYIEFIAALLDTLELEQVVIGGNSFGGQVAWEVAAAMPERIAGLVLVDAVGYPFVPESVPLAFQLARFPVLRPLIQRLLPRRVIRDSLHDVYGDPSRVDEALVDRYYELALRAGNRRALGLRFDHVMPTEERAARIRTLKQPTLILWGDRDRLIPLASADRFAADIDGSRTVVFAGLGHVPHEEAPAETVVVVEEFLATLR